MQMRSRMGSSYSAGAGVCCPKRGLLTLRARGMLLRKHQTAKQTCISYKRQPPHCPETHSTGALHEGEGSSWSCQCPGGHCSAASHSPEYCFSRAGWLRAHHAYRPTELVAHCTRLTDTSQTVLERIALRRFESKKGWWRSLATPPSACLATWLKGERHQAGFSGHTSGHTRDSLCLSSSSKVTQLLQASWLVDSPSF